MSKIILSTKALLNHEGKYLFLKEVLHRKHIWDLPGGKIEYGEEPEQALIREVKEEVDIDAIVEKMLGVWWFYSQNNQYQVFCLTYLCKPSKNFTIDFTKNPADEHFTEYCWLSATQALNNPDMKLAKSLRKILASI